MHHEDPCGLPALDARVARDLDRLAYPDKRWVLDLDAQQLADIAPDVKPEQVLNCGVIGGGQFGLTIAHGLQRECVNRVQVFDRNPRGLEGPWMTFARMQTLRTPKRHTGHELGNASLGFQSWYEAQHGSEGWERLFRISRQDWQAYLVWYREVTGVDVINDGEVTAVEPWPDADRCVLFRLTIEKSGQQSRAWARTVVFASGSEGSGGQQIPGFISDHLPKRLYAHTSEWPIDFSALAGKRIGLLGSGASAFDAAIKALEAGASQAVLCFRRPALPLDNPRRWMEFSGFLAHYPELSDAERWRYAQHVSSVGQPPPLPTFERAIAQPGFVMMPGTPWLSVREDDGRVVVSTPHGEERFDFVFAATGSLVDLKARPEFAGMPSSRCLVVGSLPAASGTGKLSSDALSVSGPPCPVHGQAARRDAMGRASIHHHPRSNAVDGAQRSVQQQHQVHGAAHHCRRDPSAVSRRRARLRAALRHARPRRSRLRERSDDGLSSTPGRHGDHRKRWSSMTGTPRQTKWRMSLGAHRCTMVATGLRAPMSASPSASSTRKLASMPGARWPSR